VTDKGLLINMGAEKSNHANGGRARGAGYGLYIGDALAMPVHWYYDRVDGYEGAVIK